MFLDDLTVLLVANAGLVKNVTLFATSKADLTRAGDGPFLVIKETGGSGPEGTHNAVAFGLPGYQRPNAQIIAVCTSISQARTLADTVYTVLSKIGQKSQFINGVWWRSITLLQEPADVLGVDDVGRAQISFNIAVTKRPNAAMSQ